MAAEGIREVRGEHELPAAGAVAAPIAAAAAGTGAVPGASLPAPLTAREGSPAGRPGAGGRRAQEAGRAQMLASGGGCAPVGLPNGTAVANPEGGRARSRARTGCECTPPARDADTAGARPAPPDGPERPAMEIRLRCIEAGRRYYAVLVHGLELFVGTRPECDRFLAIHNRKVAEEQEFLRRVPRGRPAQLRVFRTLRA